MQAQGKNNFWIKIAIACVVLAVIFNLFSIGLGLMFSMLIGGFVDLILFVVLDVVVATILMAVDLLVFVIVDVFVAGLLIAIDVFVFLLLGALNVAGYAAMLAVVVIPLALIYKYSQKQKTTADVDYK
ncbi:MAG: hypothetical protein COB24_11590 [Hyphomicrobiales bacterium]|nr:MAG: hypothetical protein COB24_11590 [Hyphomicrobiales bacterium]